MARLICVILEKDKYSKEFLVTAFVLFANPKVQESALECDGVEYRGQKLRVEMC